jgi:hypothetical protein
MATMKRSFGLKIGLGVVAIGVVLGTVIAIYASRSSQERPSPTAAATPAKAMAPEARSSGAGMKAIAEAAKANKYLFALFCRNDDEPTRAMRRTLESALARKSARADWVLVKITEPDERSIVEKFELDRAPMPLVLALAPNGAITGGFPSKVEEKDLLEAFATPCTEKCMKALQSNKLVFLCVQNSTTNGNKAALQGVRDFQADERFGQATEVILLDPAASNEAKFLSDLQVDPKTSAAVTVFLAPPGRPVAKFEGATNKEDLVASLQKAGSGCCPGGTCGPGGCCPQK